MRVTNYDERERERERAHCVTDDNTDHEILSPLPLSLDTYWQYFFVLYSSTKKRREKSRTLCTAQYILDEKRKIINHATGIFLPIFSYFKFKQKQKRNKCLLENITNLLSLILLNNSHRTFSINHFIVHIPGRHSLFIFCIENHNNLSSVISVAGNRHVYTRTCINRIIISVQ